MILFNASFVFVRLSRSGFFSGNINFCIANALFFFDIDVGMDISGVESSMAVLKDMSRTQKKNIFLISHKDELVSRVNSVLKVVKVNGFTSYSTDLEFNNIV